MRERSAQPRERPEGPETSVTISELNNPRYAPAIKILIIPRKQPTELRDGIVHRAI